MCRCLCFWRLRQSSPSVTDGRDVRRGLPTTLGGLPATRKSPVINWPVPSTILLNRGLQQVFASDRLENDRRTVWRTRVGHGLPAGRQLRRCVGLLPGDVPGSRQDIAQGAGARLVGAVAASGDGPGAWICCEFAAGSAAAPRRWPIRMPWSAAKPTPGRRPKPRELAERLRAALAKLPPDQAAVFCLSCLDKLSYREIGERLGVTTNAVGVLLHRARGDCGSCWLRSTPGRPARIEDQTRGRSARRTYRRFARPRHGGVAPSADAPRAAAGSGCPRVASCPGSGRRSARHAIERIRKMKRIAKNRRGRKRIRGHRHSRLVDHDRGRLDQHRLRGGGQSAGQPPKRDLRYDLGIEGRERPAGRDCAPEKDSSLHRRISDGDFGQT